MNLLLKLRFRYLLIPFLLSGLALYQSIGLLQKGVEKIRYFQSLPVQTKAPLSQDFSADVTLDEDEILSQNSNYKNACSEYKKRNFNLAIEELREEIKKFPQHAQAYFLLGKIFEDVRFPEGVYLSKAIKKFEKYLSIKPTGKRAPYVKLRVAQYYVREGLSKQDVSLLDKAEEYLKSLDQNSDAVKMALGAIYLRKENYESAIAEFEKTINLEPAELRLKYNSLGLAYLKVGYFAKAQNILEIAIIIEPNNKFGHNNLGYAYAQQGKIEKAAEHFAIALRIDPKYNNAKRNLAWAEAMHQKAQNKR